MAAMDDTLEKLVISNAQTVASLTEIVKQTSRDVDKLTMYMNESIPVREQFFQLQQDVEEFKLATLKKHEEADRKFTILNPVYTVLRYPKAAVFAMIGMYAFAISDVRAGIASALKYIG